MVFQGKKCPRKNLEPILRHFPILTPYILASVQIVNPWSLEVCLFVITENKKLFLLLYKIMKFSRKICQNECLSWFSDKNSKKVTSEKAPRLKLGSYYIYRKIENIIKCTFASIIMPLNFIHFHQKIGIKSGLENFASVNEHFRRALKYFFSIVYSFIYFYCKIFT